MPGIMQRIRDYMNRRRANRIGRQWAKIARQLKRDNVTIVIAEYPDRTEWNWNVINKRRGELIDKNINGSITSDEQSELDTLLDTLQAYAEEYLDKTTPLPTDHLAHLEKILGIDGKPEGCTCELECRPDCIGVCGCSVCHQRYIDKLRSEPPQSKTFVCPRCFGACNGYGNGCDCKVPE